MNNRKKNQLNISGVKNKLLKRMLHRYLYGMIGVFIFLFFILFFITYSFRSKQGESLKEINNNLFTEISVMKNATDNIISTLYSEQPKLDDLSNITNLSLEEYYDYKTQVYMSEVSSIYRGTRNFITNAFKMNDAITAIYFYDRDTKNSVLFERGLTISMTKKENLLIDKHPKLSFFRQEFFENEEYKSLLFFHKELHKEYDLSYVADAFIFYDIAPSLEKVDQQIQQNNGIVQILTDDNQEVAVSSNTNELESFHTLDSLKVNNYVTRVMTKKSNVFTEYSTIYFLYFICIGLIVMLSFPFIFKNFVNLEKRILKVNDKLSDIRNGNFETRYIDQKDNSENSDEISLISLSIDEIAHQLNEHVTQVYKSKLKQKDYQIQSIRAQINPHFLYNTLEAIRMKAVLNDDDAVAGMLLNAASLYRNMIKGDDIVLLKDEIDFCDDYLSLFEARFEDNLFYDISYDESLDDVLIEKFSIQPIIENYIHHGIDSKRNDNFIEIHCYKNKDELLIQVTNNGKPIAKTDLVDINNQLKNNHKNNEEKTLTGLFGVDFRLKQRFGDEYGVSIENRVNSVVVTLKLPIKRGYKNESTSS